MATFEQYFIEEKATRDEKRNVYYTLRDSEAISRKILTEFGVDPKAGHIINGHVPVKVKQNESPVKAGGKLIVIDGGFAEAYQETTGIAGKGLIQALATLPRYPVPIAVHGHRDAVVPRLFLHIGRAAMGHQQYGGIGVTQVK